MTRYWLLMPIWLSSPHVRLHLGHSGSLRSGDQHHPGAVRVGQRGHGRSVDGALLVQPGQRSQTRCIALPRLQELRPGPGQLQQPDRVAGGRGVEHDLIEAAYVESSVSRAVNSLNEATSVVQEPDNCSVMAAISATGSRLRTGPTMRSR